MRYYKGFLLNVNTFLRNFPKIFGGGHYGFRNCKLR